MLAGIGSGNMYFKISPTREIAKMIKNCLMNFMLVLPVFSSDCRGRTGSRTAWGTGLVRIAEASWSARAAQAARVPRLHEALRLCGVPRLHELVLPIIIYLCVVLSRWSCGILQKQKKVIIGKLKPITFLSTSWIPRSKIIWSNWESTSQFRCLLASWIPRFDFFKVIWEVQSSKCFKIHAQHSLWFPKRHKNCLSGNCFSLGCKYLVKQFPACCFILKNGNSWRKAHLISSKKSVLKNMLGWLADSESSFLMKRKH